jgi:sugar phosphate isomerase/epimerase
MRDEMIEDLRRHLDLAKREGAKNMIVPIRMYETIVERMESDRKAMELLNEMLHNARSKP